MRTLTITTLLWTLSASAAPALEPFFVEPVTTRIAPAAGQTIDLAGTTVEPVSGVNLEVLLGEYPAAPGTPVFTSIDFSISQFAGVASVVTDPGPVAGAENLIQGGIITVDPTDQFLLELTPIATLTVDASAAAPGSQFTLAFAWPDTISGAQGSFFVAGQEISLPDKSFVITVVPEPATLVAALVGAAALASGRRERRS